MDLLVPYIVEGRSELRYPSRVNCKTHSVFGLQNTLLTERIKHLIDHNWDGGCAWLRVVWTSLHTYFMCVEREKFYFLFFLFLLFSLSLDRCFNSIFFKYIDGFVFSFFFFSFLFRKEGKKEGRKVES